MDNYLLELVVSEQREFYKAKGRGTKRNVPYEKYLKSEQITIVSGIRRSGKSTLLMQFADYYEDYHFVTFDDERLATFEVSDFQTLMTVLHKKSESKVVFFDEIQNIPKWERFIRRIHDLGYKIFITGSNAYLLSSELATHLTGRYLKVELYPFSFYEFLNFKNIDIQNITTIVKSQILNTFDTYLSNGGFPEYIKNTEKDVLQRIYEDIVYRDVIVRYKIQEIKSFKQLSQYLMTNIANEFSYHSLSNILNIKSSVSVKNYIEYLQSVYMLFEVSKYDYSLKKQYVSNKKIYAIDNGLRNTVGFNFSADKGRLLENLIIIELKIRGKNIYYFKGKNECDFVLEEKGKITELFQVCYNLDIQNETREISGILEACRLLNLTSGKIITYDYQTSKTIEGIDIEYIPAWKWLLSL